MNKCIFVGVFRVHRKIVLNLSCLDIIFRAFIESSKTPLCTTTTVFVAKREIYHTCFKCVLITILVAIVWTFHFEITISRRVTSQEGFFYSCLETILRVFLKYLNKIL